MMSSFTIHSTWLIIIFPSTTTTHLDITLIPHISIHFLNLHAPLGIRLSPWLVSPNLLDSFVNHGRFTKKTTSQIIWGLPRSQVDIARVKYSTNTLQFSHIANKTWKPIPLHHLQNTFHHCHSGQAHTYNIPVSYNPPSDIKTWS